MTALSRCAGAGAGTFGAGAGPGTAAGGLFSAFAYCRRHCRSAPGSQGLGIKYAVPEPCALGNNGGVDKSGENDYRRRALRFGEPSQYAQSVELRLNELQQHTSGRSDWI